MSPHTGTGSTGVRHRQTADQGDEQSPLLPHHARRRKGANASSTSIISFLRWHAFSPLTDFDSGASMPIAYVPPLLLQCFITGLADASTFSLTRCWVGFMTGNMVQMVINSFDLVLPSSTNAGSDQDEIRDKLVSNASALVGFMIGCQITSRLINRFSGDRTKRLFIVMFSLYRSMATLTLILFGARYPAFRLHGSLDWLVTSILAASLGCQSTYSTNLATPFSNTVVFTATLTSVSSDVQLPALGLDRSNRFKALSIFGLMSGAAVSQVILKVATKASRRSKHEAVQHALVVLSGMELLLGVAWYCCGIVSSWKQYRRPATHESEEDD